MVTNATKKIVFSASSMEKLAIIKKKRDITQKDEA